MFQEPRIIVTLDFNSDKPALQLVDQLNPKQCRLKVGKEMFTLYGPNFVEKLMQRGFDIFLDLKFHDIPNTVAGACRAAASLGVWMVNVHAQGGRSMLSAAREAIDKSQHKPLLIAVTVLTSLEQKDLQELGITEDLTSYVQRLAKLAYDCGLDGVVCSAQEASFLRNISEKFALVTPGIRPASSDKQDQKRVLTPRQAIDAGVDYLVIGRPITQAKNPMQALADIVKEIS